MKLGNTEILWTGHSGILIKTNKIIYIDPYKISGDKPKADIILLTHSHYDHCSLEDIERISKPGTVVIVPPDCQSKITKIENVSMQIMIPGDDISVEGIKICAVPAYNTNKEYHPKSEEWNGYILKRDNLVIYHAGDSDSIPEMQRLSGYGKQGNEFIAFLPVDGKFGMSAEEAADAASIIKPMIAVPIHFGSIVGDVKDAERFVKLCGAKGIKAVILEKS